MTLLVYGLGRPCALKFMRKSPSFTNVAGTGASVVKLRNTKKENIQTLDV